MARPLGSVPAAAETQVVGQTRPAMTEAAGRVFASHYQLLFCDDPSRPIPEEANWGIAAMKRGYTGSPQVRLVGTEADLNDHWVRISISDYPPDLSPWQRVTLFHFQSLTGQLHVMSVVDDQPRLSVSIGIGDFSVYVAGQNLGVDLALLDEQGPLSDAELALRTDLEWYQIFVVPGVPIAEGRIKDAG